MTTPAKGPHRCTTACVCPLHKTQLYYSRAIDDHACVDPDCVYAQGMNPPRSWTCTQQIMATDLSIEDPVEREANRVQRECGWTVEVVWPPDLPGNVDRHKAECPLPHQVVPS